MPDILPVLVDPIDLDRIRSGDSLATADALGKLWKGINQLATRQAALSQQSDLTPLYCRLYRHLTTQTIVNSTDTFLGWETPPSPGDVINGVNVGGLFDPNGAVSSGATGDQYVTLSEPGIYLIECMVKWDTNNVGIRQIAIELLGSLDLLAKRRETATGVATTGLAQSLSAVVAWRGLSTVAGPVWTGRIAISILQTSGGDRTVGTVGQFYDHWLGVTRIAGVR